MAPQYERTVVGNLTHASAASFRKTQHRTSYQVFGFSLTNSQPCELMLATAILPNILGLLPNLVTGYEPLEDRRGVCGASAQRADTATAAERQPAASSEESGASYAI